MTRLRDLTIEGLLLALPIVVVIFLFGKMVTLLVHLFAPMKNLLPDGSWLGVGALDIAAVLILVFTLIAIGAFAHTQPGQQLSAWLERIVLRKIPGFLLFKSVAAGFSSEERKGGLIPALITFDDNIALGFIVEQAVSEDDLVTVFIPAAPTPASGSVLLVRRAQVQPLDVSVSSVIHTISRLGLGTQQLVRPGLFDGSKR